MRYTIILLTFLTIACSNPDRDARVDKCITDTLSLFDYVPVKDANGMFRLFDVCEANTK